MAFVALLATGAVGMVIALVADGFRVGSPYAVAGMALVALVAERATIRLTPALETSMASLPFAFAAIVAGPLAAAIVGSVGLLVDLGRRDDPNPHLRWLAWTAKRVLSAGAAGLAASAIAETLSGSLWVTLAAAATGACAADAVVDLVLASATLLVRRKAHALHVARNLGPLYMVSVPLYASVLTVLAYAYVVISPWLTLLFLLPAFGVQRLFVLYRQQRDAAEALVVVNERLAQANASFASALVATLDARDRYTAGHSAAVAVYARDIASRLGLSEHHQNLAYLGGLVHDIGKIGLAPGLLEKPGALTPDERRQMEQHPVIGETIVQNVEDYSDIADAVRHHHERLDGNGYPDGRSGEAIPLLARIISVADAYNAMTSDRPYRDAMATEVARTRLREAAGSQFDPAIVDAFDCVLAEESESYRRAKRSDFGIDARVSPPPVLLRAA